MDHALRTITRRNVLCVAIHFCGGAALVFWVALSAPTLEVRAAPPSVEDLQRGFAPLLSRAGNHVVRVEVNAGRVIATDTLTRNEPDHRSGSGVRFGSIIITNFHVIRDALSVYLRFPDKNRTLTTARVVAIAPDLDLAALRADNPPPPPADPMRAVALDRTSIGDVVFALGYPFGDGLAASIGIVAGVGTEAHVFPWMIKTDAQIFPGNSGGALIDVEGRLVGINSGVRYSTPRGLALAVPGELATRMASEIQRYGRWRRPWLGVHLVDKPERNAYPSSRGLAVRRATARAVDAGLRVGDVIVSADGQVTDSARVIDYLVGRRAVGERVQLVIERGGNTIDLDYELVEPPDSPPGDRRMLGAENGLLDGVDIINFSPRRARRYGFSPWTSGVLVVAVRAGSVAESLGVRALDRLWRVDGRVLHNASATAAIPARVEIDIIRGGERLTLGAPEPVSAPTSEAIPRAIPGTISDSIPSATHERRAQDSAERNVNALKVRDNSTPEQ